MHNVPAAPATPHCAARIRPFFILALLIFFLLVLLISVLSEINWLDLKVDFIEEKTNIKGEKMRSGDFR